MESVPVVDVDVIDDSTSNKHFPPQLRDRQQEIVQQTVEISLKEKRALISAPTGYGKTAMFSSIITKLAASTVETRNKTSIKALKKPTKRIAKSHKLSLFKVVVLSHTVELNRQNENKFKFWNDGSLSTGIYGDGQYNSTAQVIFATYQMFSRDGHLAKFPWVSLLVIDEAHHAPTDSYQKVIKRLLEGNPDMMILGLTATPSRADKKLMIKTFPRITSVVKVQEAIDEGVLVKPEFKAMVLKDARADKILKDKLYALERDASMLNKKNRYAKLVDEQATNDAVVTHWKEHAGDRQTVVFCSTIDHCRHVTEAFKAAGVKAGLVHSQMSQSEEVLKAYSQGKIQVIVNVFKLTEGWDDPATSCVVLLRPSSNLNTWRQMIGRGLRSFPKKENCIILDFGMSTLIHIRTPEVTGLDEEEDLQAEEEEGERRRKYIGEDEEVDSAFLQQLLRLVGAAEIEMKDVNSIRPSNGSVVTTEQQRRPGISGDDSWLVKAMAMANVKPERTMPKLSLTPKSTSVRPIGATIATAIAGTDHLFKTITSDHIIHFSPSNRDGHGDKWIPPVYTTRWSFPQCSDYLEATDAPPPEEEEGSNGGLIRIPSVAEHHVLQTYELATSKGALAIVTQPYLHNNDWVALCGEVDTMAVIALSNNKQACLSAASKWWAENWDHQYAQMLAMDRPYNRPSEAQLKLLTQKQHRHQIDHPMFTKYSASLLLALLLNKYKILDALDRSEGKMVGEITRRPPWRRKED